MGGLLIRQQSYKDRDNQGEGCVMKKAEPGMRGLQTRVEEGHQHLRSQEEASKDSPHFQRDCGLAGALIGDFWPPEV